MKIEGYQPLTELLRRNAEVQEPILADRFRLRAIQVGYLPQGFPRQILYGAYRDRNALIGAAVVARAVRGEVQSLQAAGRGPLEWVDRAWHIAWMAVDESERGQGVARLLTEKIVADAREAGIPRVDGVADGPASLDEVYRRLGFVVTDQNDSPWMLELQRELRERGVLAQSARPDARYFYRDL